MPRSRSRSIESSTCSCPAWLRRRRPVVSSRRSASVDLPWSTCAMMQKFRMWDAFTRSGRSRGGSIDGGAAQELREAGERAAAVAHAVLRGGRRLGERLPELRGQEERIVAEAAAAPLRGEDRPLGRAVGREHDVAAVDEADRAAEARGAGRRRDAGELAQQLRAVVRVGGGGT